MKKLILSAVMMVAFVGTSFAKSGEVEVKKDQLQLNKKMELISLSTITDSPQDCGAVAEFGAMNAERHYSATHGGACMTDAGYNSIYMMYYELCMQ